MNDLLDRAEKNTMVDPHLMHFSYAFCVSHVHGNRYLAFCSYLLSPIFSSEDELFIISDLMELEQSRTRKEINSARREKDSFGYWSTI